MPIPTSLVKQLLGALAGATIAFVLYQGYSFTSSHLTALITLPGGVPAVDLRASPRRDFPRPVGTWDSPVVVSSASAASSTTLSSSRSSENRPYLGPFGTLRGLKKFFQAPVTELASSSAVALVMDMAGSSSWSSISSTSSTSSVRILRHVWTRMALQGGTVSSFASSRTPRSIPVRTPVVASMPQGRGALPQSGFGMEVIAFCALGAVIGRMRAIPRRSERSSAGQVKRV
ncbi:hypothetical protein EXS70_01045 [Candidatus Peribacteria bacterium]|nr:hypothetical protein [Candidatus Peribacteria bacterium]